ncbi:MAG: DMT family transporter [Planctomycetota bacterium]|jgi:drug/metabolite transporter (DMT)-like permease
MDSIHTRKIDTAATMACIATVICFSIGPIFIKLLTGYVDLWTQNLLRYIVASLVWLPWLLFTIKKGRFERRIWQRAIWPATVNIFMQSLWAASFYYINPAFMSLLVKSFIIWIAAFSFIFFPEERPLVKSKRFWSGIVLSAIGVIGVIVFKADFATTKTMTGIVLALSAAFGWAMYTITVKIAFKDIDSRKGFSVISIYTVAGLFVLALIFGRPGISITMGLKPWAYVVISALTAIAISHVLYYVAIKRLGATIPALVLLATPFTVLAGSYLVFGESLNGFQWLFGMVLLTGSAIAIWAQQHLNKTT